MQNRTPNSLIQNHPSWCWAVCAKIAGDLYKSKYPMFNFALAALEKQHPFGMPIEDITGFRPDCLGFYDGKPTVDLWQWMITRAASRTHMETATDDEKMRALKFVVTGDVTSTRVEVACVGKYGSNISLFPLFTEVLADYLNANECVIGNYRIKGKNMFHSVIIRKNDAGLTVYDPWDGTTWPVTLNQLLTDGFPTNLGQGVIEWVLYIE